jgi:hypothetical protein
MSQSIVAVLLAVNSAAQGGVATAPDKAKNLTCGTTISRAVLVVRKTFIGLGFS